jgi:type II secretory pathway pseudopilin PulG
MSPPSRTHTPMTDFAPLPVRSSIRDRRPELARLVLGTVPRGSAPHPASTNAMPGHEPPMNRRGFTYLIVLAILVAAGMALTGANIAWTTAVRREKEAELLFRGDQYRRAFASWIRYAPGGRVQYPTRLEDLLKDPRTPGLRRHLRQLYPDPMVPDGKWGLVRNASGAIRGVFSQHPGKPLKSAGFAEIYAGFKDARSYADWKFGIALVKERRVAGSQAASAAQSNAPGPTSPSQEQP